MAGRTVDFPGADARARRSSELSGGPGRAPEAGAGLLRRLLGPPGQEVRLRRVETRHREGAEGERQLAAWLAGRCPGVPMLHDRLIPGTGSGVDHIAVAPSGLYVIACERYRGRIEVTNPLFGRPKLKIAGRDHTALVEALDVLVQRVRALLAQDGVPVSGCLCFLAPEGLMADVGLPLFGTRELNGYPLYYQKRLAKRLNATGPLTPARAEQLHERLARLLPPAAPGPQPDLAA